MSETSTVVTGGCQCGAVRYAMHATPQRAHYCHCRMCQRATGNLFAALAGCRKSELEWTRGMPSSFASSTLARRGFCAACGTPLTFAYDAADWIYVMIGSLDDPSLAPPERHIGIESKLHWLDIHDGLPREETKADERLKQMTVFQFGGMSSHG